VPVRRTGAYRHKKALIMKSQNVSQSLLLLTSCSDVNFTSISSNCQMALTNYLPLHFAVNLDISSVA